MILRFLLITGLFLNFYGGDVLQEDKADCQIIREIEVPLTKKPNVKIETKIALLNTCLDDTIPQQRPVIEVVRNGKKEFRTFEVLKIFTNQAEAEKYAETNGITDIQISKDVSNFVIRKIIPDARIDIGDVKLEKFVLYEIGENYSEDIYVVENGVTKSVKAKLIKAFANGQGAQQFAKDSKIIDTPFAELGDCQIIRVIDMPMSLRGDKIANPKPEIVLLTTCIFKEHEWEQLPRIKLMRMGKEIERDFWEIRVLKDKDEALEYAKQNGLYDVDFSSKTEIGKIDAELTQAFHNSMRGEISYELVNKFRELIKEKLKNPLTFDERLFNLENEIFIVASPDKHLKFYSWDNRTGGTWHNMSVIAQYKDEKGIIRVKELNDPHLDELPEQSDFLVKEIYEIKVKNQTQYLTIGWGTHGSGHQFDIIKIFRIKDSSLLQDSSILPEKYDLIITYPRMMKSALSFDPTTNQISYSEFVEDEDSGFMKPTGKIIKLKLMNGKFTR